ncbi:TBCC domain-containing protein 1 [Taenia solium]|eukprot:TsM_001145000 transcript=TsM_001145000 gene=TsM_001145000
METEIISNIEPIDLTKETVSNLENSSAENIRLQQSIDLYTFALTKTFSMRCLYSWIRANLCQCPFTVESCTLNGTHVHWGKVGSATASLSAKSSKRRQKIATNFQQLPPSTGFRGNKIVAAEMLHKQFIARGSRFLKYSTVRLYRATSSSIYLLAPLRCVALDRCRNSTIVLGPIESTLTLTDCEDCLIIAAARRVVVWTSRRCTLHLLCATRPLLLQQPPITTSTAAAGTNDPHSCPPSPLSGVARGHNSFSNEDIIFAPFHTTYPELRHHLDKAALNPTVNLWGKPLLFGNDFWRSGLNQCQSNGIWGLLPPDNFFPFNIPLAPLMTNEEGGGVAHYADIGSAIPSVVGMCLKQKACDVCRGVIVDCSRDGDSPNGDFDMSEEDLDSPVKRATLLVPLPPVYAEAVNKRRAAYETWQKTIQRADLTEDENSYFAKCIEAQFQAWLVESGMLEELKVLDSASNVSKERRLRRSEISAEEANCATTPSSFTRRSHFAIITMGTPSVPAGCTPALQHTFQAVPPASYLFYAMICFVLPCLVSYNFKEDSKRCSVGSAFGDLEP